MSNSTLNAQCVINKNLAIDMNRYSIDIHQRGHHQHEEDDEKPDGRPETADPANALVASYHGGAEGPRHEQPTGGREPSPEGGDQRGGTRIG